MSGLASDVVGRFEAIVAEQGLFVAKILGASLEVMARPGKKVRLVAACMHIPGCDVADGLMGFFADGVPSPRGPRYAFLRALPIRQNNGIVWRAAADFKQRASLLYAWAEPMGEDNRMYGTPDIRVGYLEVS